MRTQETQIGTYAEWLVEDASVASTILEKNRDINVEYGDWQEDVINCFLEDLDAKGFDVQIMDVQFTGFHSQGDGASFTGSIDILDFLKANRILSKYRTLTRALRNDVVINSVDIYRSSSNYSHENTCSVDDMIVNIEDAMTDKLYFELEEVQELLEEERYSLSKELYSRLENDYNCLTEDEVVIETLESNKYSFDEDGEIV